MYYNTILTDSFSPVFSSGIQKGDSVVSLDQLQRSKERQESPTNSPNGKDEYVSLVEKLMSNNHVFGATSNLTDITDKKSGGYADIDAGYESPISVHEDEDVTRVCTPDSQRSKDSGCEDNVPYTTDLYDNEMDMNPDQFAPFIPPPGGNSPFFAGCMQMCSMDETLGDDDLMWSNESWEILEPEVDMRTMSNDDFKRNLSTPKFFLSEDDLPILNSNEVEMSTPVSNLPLLEGNEIWFALDQGREITV